MRNDAVELRWIALIRSRVVISAITSIGGDVVDADDDDAADNDNDEDDVTDNVGWIIIVAMMVIESTWLYKTCVLYKRKAKPHSTQIKKLFLS